MENRFDSHFFEVFTNYPDIDRNSFTTIEYISYKYNVLPIEAREWIEEAVKQGLIEEVVSVNSPMGVVSYKQKYKITQKCFQEYIQSEDV